MKANTDCRKCDFSCYFDDGSDYEDMVWHCTKLNVCVTFTKVDKKPCGLQEGKYYVASYYVFTNQLQSK